MSTGEQGDTGEQGLTGERGDTGDRGVGGERGPKGDHGQAGDIGLTGDIGERGDTGDKGERGDTGEQGIEGKSTLLSRNIAVSYLLLAVVSAIVLGIMGYTIVQNRDLIHRIDSQQRELDALAQATHTSLCTFTTDLQRRRDDSVKYLAEHPRGVISPVTNAVIITPAEIQQNIDNQNATLKALSGLKC